MALLPTVFLASGELITLLFFFKKYFYLFIWLLQASVVACEVFGCGM